MKNYFTSVVIPKGENTTARLSSALFELVDQLRYTVNNLDFDNMTENTVRAIKSGAVHIKTVKEITEGRITDVKKGDLVVVVGEQNGRLCKVNDIYICVNDVPDMR